MRRIFTILALISLYFFAIVPQIFAAGTLDSSSTIVGQTVTFDAKLDFSFCDPSQQTFDIYHGYLLAKALDGQGNPIDFTTANIGVKVNGLDVPGFVYYRFPDGLVWFPNYPDLFPYTITRNDLPEIIVTGAKILVSGRVGFTSYFHQGSSWDSCISLNKDTVSPNPYNQILNFTYQEASPSPIPTATPIPTPSPSPTPTPVPSPSPTPTPTPDTTAPSVNITNPVNGSTVTRNKITIISAFASDNVGVTKVEFYVNNSLICTDTIAAYNCDWFVPKGKPQTYLLQAKAYDSAGNVNQNTIQVNSH